MDRQIDRQYVVELAVYMDNPEQDCLGKSFIWAVAPTKEAAVDKVYKNALRVYADVADCPEVEKFPKFIVAKWRRDGIPVAPSLQE